MMAHWYLSSCKLNGLDLYTHVKELFFLRYVIVSACYGICLQFQL